MIFQMTATGRAGRPSKINRNCKINENGPADRIEFQTQIKEHADLCLNGSQNTITLNSKTVNNTKYTVFIRYWHSLQFVHLNSKLSK